MVNFLLLSVPKTTTMLLWMFKTSGSDINDIDLNALNTYFAFFHLSYFMILSKRGKRIFYIWTVTVESLLRVTL